MTVRSAPWPAGCPCWTDLQTPDLARAQAFYGRVFGWEFTADIRGEFDGYSVAHRGGATTGGIGPSQSANMPSSWTLYFSSTDADATAATIAEHGGTILLPPGDVGHHGRLCIAVDPTGAVFGVWQAGIHIGLELVNEPGGVIWEDLRSPDPRTAWAFYGAVFGHETTPLAMAGEDYATFAFPGEAAPLGGMGPLLGTPSAHWTVYFAVEDADAAVAAATGIGGSVVDAPRNTPFGRIAHLADPFGATFHVMAALDTPAT